jgi:erythromycin esterase
MRRLEIVFWAGTLALTTLTDVGVSANRGDSSHSQAADETRAARIDYLKKNAVPVRSIDAEDEDFADLAPLRRAIGDRRIIMLGENSHGDGATFAAKSRLIKFLHKQMGFDVLAFESGFYDVHRAWRDVRSGEDPLAAIASGVDPIWYACHQTQPLWKYIAAQSKTDRPLELCGFDMQFTGSASSDHLLKDLDAYLAQNAWPPDIRSAAARVRQALAMILEYPNYMWNGSPFKGVPPGGQAAVLTDARALIEALGSLHPPDRTAALERDFWVQGLKSGAALLEMSWGVDAQSLEKTAREWAMNIRDRQMADNFTWLAKSAYPDRKIIIWAATSHIIRRRETLMKGEDSLVLMGELIDPALGSEIYALGFTSYRGRWGTTNMAEPVAVVSPGPNSLEELLFAAGFEYALLDLRNPGAGGAWLREPLAGRAMTTTPRTAVWTGVLDGLFFIREQVPGTPLEKKKSAGH